MIDLGFMIRIFLPPTQLSPCWPEALCVAVLTYPIEIVMQGVEHKVTEEQSTFCARKQISPGSCVQLGTSGGKHTSVFFTLECLVLKA